MKVSFIGLGVMGFPMAAHLVKAGFEVTVFNRTHSKALDWADKHQGKAAESVAECVAEADVVLVCVGNDDDVRSMTTSEAGALAAMKPNAILVDHTTTSAILSEEPLDWLVLRRFLVHKVLLAEKKPLGVMHVLLIQCDQLLAM